MQKCSSCKGLFQFFRGRQQRYCPNEFAAITVNSNPWLCHDCKLAITNNNTSHCFAEWVKRTNKQDNQENTMQYPEIPDRPVDPPEDPSYEKAVERVENNLAGYVRPILEAAEDARSDIISDIVTWMGDNDSHEWRSDNFSQLAAIEEVIDILEGM